MTHPTPVVPAPTVPGRRRLLCAALAALLLGFATRPPVPHTPVTFLAGDGTKTGTGGG